MNRSSSEGVLRITGLLRGRTVLLFTVGLLALTDTTNSWGEEAPSWFSYNDSTVSVDVCNVVMRGKDEVDLTDFAPAAGAAWSREHDPGVSCYAFPIKTVGVYLDGTSTLSIQVRGGRIIPMLDASWLDHHQGGTAYTLVIFKQNFRLKDVIGFTLANGPRHYSLTFESKLR